MSSKRQWSGQYSKRIPFPFNDSNPFTAFADGATCCGAHGHQTFYGAVVRSPEWRAWEEEQETEETCYDMPEVVECGSISSKHFAEFLAFVRGLPAMPAPPEIDDWNGPEPEAGA